MSRQPGGGRDHVLLRDPALDEPIGKGQLERAHAAVGGEIGIEHDELLVPLAQRDERLAVRLDHVLVGDCRPAPGTRAALGLAFEAARLLDRLDVSYVGGPRPSSANPSSIRAASSARARSNGSSAGAPACQR